MVQQIAHLPPAFELLPRLLLLLSDEESDCEALARLIRVDAGLTADLVRASNSASFGGRYRSVTVQDAIIRLGMREIFKIAVKLIASPALEGVYSGPVARLDLWQHSLAVAVGSQVIASRTSYDTEVAFTAGLLHDIGKTVLAQKHGAIYIQLLDECRLKNEPIREAELRRFNVDHATTGADLLEDWNFPEKIVNSLRNHHQPRFNRESDRLLAITNVANSLAYRLGFGCGFPVETVRPNSSALAVLGLSSLEIEGLEERTGELFEREREPLREDAAVDLTDEKTNLRCA